MVRKLRSLRGIITVGILLIAAAVGLIAHNGYEVSRQVKAITDADNAGQSVTGALEKLRSYASSHIGASTRLTLQGSYNRAAAAAKSAAAAQASLNGQVYAQAQAACSGRTDSITQARCVQSYVSQRLVAAPTPAPVQAPELTTYIYSFKSPWWTSDAAGLLLLAGIASLIAALVTLGSRRRSRG